MIDSYAFSKVTISKVTNNKFWRDKNSTSAVHGKMESEMYLKSEILCKALPAKPRARFNVINNPIISTIKILLVIH
jgi:hypothetical protein